MSNDDCRLGASLAPLGPSGATPQLHLGVGAFVRLSPSQLNERLRALDGGGEKRSGTTTQLNERLQAAVGGEKRSGTRKWTGLWTICDRDIRGFLEDNCVSTGGLPMPL